MWDFRFEGDSLRDTSTHAYTLTAAGTTFANSTTYAPIPVIDGWSSYLPVGRTGNPLPLSGLHSITSTGDGTPTAFLWSKVSGPGLLTFSSTTASQPTVTTSTPGEYVIRLTITDSAAKTANIDQTVGFVTTDSNCVVGNSTEFDAITGSVMAHGCSPWPWYDVTEAAVAAQMKTPWATPPTETPGCGTAAIEVPSNIYHTGDPRGNTIEGPISTGRITMRIIGCTVAPGDMGSGYGYIRWTDANGFVINKQISLTYIDSTHIDTGQIYMYEPLSAMSAGTMTWGTTDPVSLIGWRTGRYQNHWNFYEAGLGMYRLYRRTNLTTYRDSARTLCTNWYSYALGGGYDFADPMDSAYHFIMACAADNHSEWWPTIDFMVKRQVGTSFIGGWHPAFTTWPNADIRESSYMTRFTSLMAKYYPSHDGNPTASRAEWCGFLADQINHFWTLGTALNSGQDYYWTEDVYVNNISYPVATDPVGDPAGKFGTSPWRGNGLATTAVQYAWESLSDGAVCADTKTSDKLYKPSDGSGIIPKAANFIWDYGRTSGGGVYYSVIYPSLSNDIHGNILFAWQGQGSMTMTNGSTAVVGVNTQLTKEIPSNGTIRVVQPGEEITVTVATVIDDTHMTLSAPWSGATSPQPWAAYIPTGTSIAVTNNSTAVVGTNTRFTHFFAPCDGSTFIGIPGAALRRTYQVVSCTDDTHLSINAPWAGATESGIAGVAKSINAQTNCAPSLAAYCERDSYDPAGRAITADIAASSAWLYAKTGLSSWLTKAQTWLGKVYGGTPGGSGSDQGVPTGPYADGGVGGMGVTLPACGANPAPCGAAYLDNFKAKYFGMNAGAGNASIAMAHLASAPGNFVEMLVDFKLASVPNARQVRLTLMKADGSITTSICQSNPCKIRADSALARPKLTLEYLDSNGTVLAASETHTIKIR